ncbi:MAG: GNAT family N-acetyltransferase [Bryobacteraceae bacterium]
MHSRIEIRQAVRRDVDRILEIEAASFGREAWDRELFDEALEDCPELFLIAKLSGRIAGYSITCFAKGKAELISIAVFPDARRRGVGEALVRFTLRALKRRKVAVWRLMVRIGNEDAVRFYKGLGFVRVRTVKGYYGPDVDAWAMELRLA